MILHATPHHVTVGTPSTRVLQASPFTRRLADNSRPNRVRHPTDWSFTSCCFPPCLTATQLHSVTGPESVCPGKDFHPTVHVRFQAHECGGLPPLLQGEACLAPKFLRILKPSYLFTITSGGTGDGAEKRRQGAAVVRLKAHMNSKVKVLIGAYALRPRNRM